MSKARRLSTIIAALWLSLHSPTARAESAAVSPVVPPDPRWVGKVNFGWAPYGGWDHLALGAYDADADISPGVEFGYFFAPYWSVNLAAQLDIYSVGNSNPGNNPASFSATILRFPLTVQYTFDNAIQAPFTASLGAGFQILSPLAIKVVGLTGTDITSTMSGVGTLFRPLINGSFGYRLDASNRINVVAEYTPFDFVNWPTISTLSGAGDLKGHTRLWLGLNYQYVGF